MNSSFDYNLAFSRNIGWVTESEQALLCTKKIAIAGLGGVGGSHLITLSRLGVGKFNISDLDVLSWQTLTGKLEHRSATWINPRLK